MRISRNRNRLIAGIAILAALGIMGLIGLALLLGKWKVGQPQTSQRAPILELTHCNPNNIPPCVQSFGIDSDGNTLVNLLIPASFPQDFYLKIVRNTGESRYECQSVENFPTHYYCLGDKLPPGGVFLLMLVSSRDDLLLAQGNIPIIGLEFPTLEIVTPTQSATPTEQPAQELVTKTPVPTRSIPGFSTPTKPSYPNPSSSYP